MNKDNELLLKKRYPNLYSHMHNPPENRPFWTIELFGLECGDGWFDLIDSLSSKIENLIMDLPESERKHFWVCQVKEKFGSLRFYMNVSTDEMEDLIEKAENISYKTCEICGSPGRPIGGGWISVRCQRCERRNNEN